MKYGILLDAISRSLNAGFMKSAFTLAAGAVKRFYDSIPDAQDGLHHSACTFRPFVDIEVDMNILKV